MTRCHLCPGTNNMVPLHGPRRHGGVLFIGEAPGAEENKKLIPFIGKTGDEVNKHYLPLAGMRREACDFTNAIKCLPVSAGGKLDLKRGADQRLLKSCAEAHLYAEMAELDPILLVPLGAFACYSVDPAISLDIQHGFPVETRWGIQAFPMYHPAGGIHEPKKMLHLRTDWQRLKSYLAGVLRLPSDPHGEPDYAEVTTVAEIRALDYTQPLAADTESSRALGPYCLTYSQRPGHGRLLRATRVDLLAALQTQLTRWQGHIYFHNWLYDFKVVAEMGLQFPQQRIRDTMIWAFHLGNLPQGLKALAWRELGMEMQDFEDLVIPYSRLEVLDYYRAAQEIDWGKPAPEMVQKDGEWTLYQPQSFNTKLKRFFTDYARDPERDVSQAWEKNWTAEHQRVERILGPWPGMDIAHVPFDQALYYACRDSDALIRLAPILKAMRRNVRRRPQERWRAA